MVKKVVARVLLALFLVIVTALILLPGIARRYAVKHSKELVGRQIGIDKLKLNYFTGMVRVTGFVMYEADEKEKFISFDTLTLHLKPFQFFVDEFVMTSFYLKGLESKVILQDSSFNFDDLIAFHAVEEEPGNTDSVSSEPFRYNLSNIELKDARFIFDDRNIGKVTDLSDISFFIPFIGWNQEDKSEAGLNFSFMEEGYFESRIDVDPIGGDFSAEISVDQLHLKHFSEYVSSSLNISNMSGVFNADLSITGNINEPERAVVKGRSVIEGFELFDSNDRKFLGNGRFICVLNELGLGDMSVSIDSLIISEPYVYFEMDTVTNNFFEAFNITPDTADQEESAAHTPVPDSADSESFYYAVDYIRIEDGTADYRDNLTGEPFDYHLSDIFMEADSIESTSEWIDLYSTMLLNKRGTLNANVGFNPADPMDIKLDYVIADFMLSDLNIYSRFYMGFPVIYGDMYYKSETEIMNGQLESENEIIIKHVELGEKSGGLYDLPLKFALFLLTDRNGVITLDIPVRGDLNDPTVRLGRIIWNTFKNLIIKVAAAPFDLLAGMLGVDPKDIESVTYDYLDTTLTHERTRQLELLLELEQKKKGLDIEMVYFNDSQKEKEALAVMEVKAQFLAASSRNSAEDEEAFRKYLEDRVPREDSLTIEAACLKLSDPVHLDSTVALFNRTRINQVSDFLRMSNDSTTIRTSISNPSAPKNLGSRPEFEVKYSMLDTDGDEN